MTVSFWFENTPCWSTRNVWAWSATRFFAGYSGGSARFFAGYSGGSARFFAGYSGGSTRSFAGSGGGSTRFFTRGMLAWNATGFFAGRFILLCSDRFGTDMSVCLWFQYSWLLRWVSAT